MLRFFWLLFLNSRCIIACNEWQQKVFCVCLFRLFYFSSIFSLDSLIIPFFCGISQITYSGTSTIPAGSAVSITLLTQNQDWSGEVGDFPLIETALSSGELIEVWSTAGGQEAIAALPDLVPASFGSIVPVVSSTSSVAGEVCDLTFAFTLACPFPVGASITLSLPSSFTTVAAQIVALTFTDGANVVLSTTTPLAVVTGTYSVKVK
jgi:hypothetical protein